MSSRGAACVAAAYVVLTFAWLWFAAYEIARGRYHEETISNISAGVLFAFVLPALVGVGVGRWWAVALVLWLVPAGLIADRLEPLREPSGELETTAELTALIAAVVHAPLLLAGVALRKLAIRRGVGRKT